MKRIITILIVIFSILVLVGCDKEKDSKLYLDSKFYDKSEYIKINAEEFDKLEDKVYVVYTYESFCKLRIPCEQIFKEVMDKYNLTFYSLFVQEAQKTYIADTVRYAPSIIIIKNNKIVAYLDANSDEDLDKYQDSEQFEKWLGEYIHLEKKHD